MECFRHQNVNSWAWNVCSIPPCFDNLCSNGRKRMRIPKQSESVSRGPSTSYVDEGKGVAPHDIQPFPTGGWNCEHTGGNPPVVADGGVMCINHEQYMCW